LNVNPSSQAANISAEKPIKKIFLFLLLLPPHSQAYPHVMRASPQKIHGHTQFKKVFSQFSHLNAHMVCEKKRTHFVGQFV
jgi:hypothetical protein